MSMHGHIRDMIVVIETIFIINEAVKAIFWLKPFQRRSKDDVTFPAPALVG